MFARTWIRRLFARTPHTRRPAPAPARFRPRLEALEGRLAPAVLTVNSTADNTTDTSAGRGLAVQLPSRARSESSSGVSG